jgi:two-component sensor histidine kinase
VASLNTLKGAGNWGDDDLAFGDSEIGLLIRAFDWSKTGLGETSEWSSVLKTTVGILLRSPVAMVLLWGADGVMIYNDAYSVFAEGRHPQLFGSKVREGWPEVADFNDNVMKMGLRGKSISYHDKELTLNRKGVPERVWMNLDYSPVPDETGQTAGVLAIVVETTQRVLAERALAKAEERLNQALNAGGMVGTFDWHIQKDAFFADARLAEMFSVDPARGEAGAPIAEYFAGIHRDDVNRAELAIKDTLATGKKYVQEYRLHKAGCIRWVETRGECLYEEDGTPARFVGVVVDITDQKDAQDRQRLLAKESNHRVKNLFAVFHGMISLSARSARTPNELAQSLRGRLDALMLAKDLIRPGIMGTEHESEQTTVDAVVRTVLRPYDDDTHERIVVSGPSVIVGTQAVTSLALALHEATTNAAKYGALSNANGMLHVEWRELGSDLHLEWKETGGPTVSKPQTGGFGSILTERSITSQLGGRIEYVWEPSGLKLVISVPLERLQT